jgi:hypothetical protein
MYGLNLTKSKSFRKICMVAVRKKEWNDVIAKTQSVYLPEILLNCSQHLRLCSSKVCFGHLGPEKVNDALITISVEEHADTIYKTGTTKNSIFPIDRRSS